MASSKRELQVPTSRPVDRRRRRQSQPGGRPRIAAAAATIGASVVVCALYASTPNVDAKRVQLSAASNPTPNELLAALVEAGPGAVATHYAAMLADPADVPAAIAAIINGYTPSGYDHDITLWAVPLGGLGQSGSNAGWTLNPFGGPAGELFGAAGALQTTNQFGPLTFDFGNHGTISLSVIPNEANPTGGQPIFNAGDIASWTAGLPGLLGSTGNTGWTVNNTFGGGNGGIFDVAGILQTANQFGPAVFNLNVVKAVNFTQPLNGTLLANGQLDDIHAVDIGQWVVGIPGLFSNTGTTGFIADWGYGNGLGTGYWTGGLQTTTQIGPFSFTFTFFPTIGFPGPSPVSTLAVGGSPSADIAGDTGTLAPNVGAQIAALKSAPMQLSAQPSTDSARINSQTGDKADPRGDNSPLAAVLPPTVASLGPTTTSLPSAPTDTPTSANGGGVTDSPTQIVRQTPAETINPLGAVTLNPTNPSGAGDSASGGTTPTAGSTDGSSGRHSSDGDYVGKHRSDDGYVGKHRLDSTAATNETSSGASGSSATAGS
jgi:hypothetical protein